METATQPSSSPETPLSVELLESSFKRAARGAPEFVDAVFTELVQSHPGAEQTVRGHDQLG